MPHSHSKLVAGFIYGLIFLFLSTGIARAQVALSIQGEDGWILNAAVVDGQVVGFLATHDPSTIPVGSYANVWFERQSDGSFTAAGNVVDTPTAVAKRIEIDKSASLFGQPELNDPSDPIAATLTSFYVGPFQVTLDPLNKGLAEDDPFQSIIDLLDEDEMELVIELGGHGAVSLSAMAIAVNTCQPDTGTGSSAHGVSLLESRLSSVADRFDQLLPLSEEDWSNVASGDSTLPLFASQQFCCKDEDITIKSNITTKCGPPAESAYVSTHCVKYCDEYHFETTMHVKSDCSSGPSHTSRIYDRQNYQVTLPKSDCP